MKKTMYVTAAMLLLLSSSAAAAEEPEDLGTSSVYGIQAKRADVKPDTVIRPDAENRPQTVAQMLEQSAGLQIQTRPNAGGNEDLSIKLRGHDSRHYMVLVDGVPQSMSGVMGGSYVNWNAIPVEWVDRIEITKGAKAAAYGQTDGGVINIITKRDHAEGGRVRLTTGSTGRRQYDFTYGGRAGDLHYAVYGTRFYRDAWLRNSDESDGRIGGSLAFDMSPTDRLLMDFDHAQIRRGLVVQNQAGSANGFQSYYPVTPYGDNFPSANSLAADGSFAKIYHNQASVTWDSKRVDGTDTLTLWTEHEKQHEVKRNATQGLMFDRYNVTDESSGLVYRGSHEAGAAHTLGYGLEYRQLRYGNSWYNGTKKEGGDLYPSQKQDVYGLWVADRWQMSPRIQGTIGLRYDRTKGGKDADVAGNHTESLYDGALSPKFNFTFRHDDATETGLSINHIWRAPSMGEFYWYYAGTPMTSYNHAKGTALHPEKGWEYEVSFRHRFDEGTRTKLSLYYQKIDDFISFVHTFPFNVYNSNDVRIWGAEWENRVRLGSKFQTYLNYTYQRTEKDGTRQADRIALKDALDYRPEHILSLGAEYASDGWKIDYDLHYTGRQRAIAGFPAATPAAAHEVNIGGALVHNLSVTKELTDACAVNVSLYNLFDKDYCEIYGYPMEGRWGTVTLTTRF